MKKALIGAAAGAAMLGAMTLSVNNSSSWEGCFVFLITYATIQSSLSRNVMGKITNNLRRAGWAGDMYPGGRCFPPEQVAKFMLTVSNQ